MTSRLWLIAGPLSLFIRRIIYKFLNMCSFDCAGFAVSRRVGYPKTTLTTPVGWLLLLQLTVRPKSVINHCAFDVLVAFCVVYWFLNFLLVKRAFRHRTESDLVLFFPHH